MRLGSSDRLAISTSAFSPGALQAGNFGGGTVAFGLQSFDLGDQRAASVVKFFERGHADGRMTLGQSGGDHLGIFLQQFEIKHFGAPC